MDKTKDGRVGIQARISPTLYKAFKIRATRKGIKVYELLEEAIEKYLKEEKK